MGLFRKKRVKEQYGLVEETTFVVGDSHARAFAHNRNFFPLFLGPGKTVNFTSESCAVNLEERMLKALKSFKAKRVLTCFGEPDTRWLLGRGWYPWDETSSLRSVDLEDEMKAALALHRAAMEKLKTADYEVACLSVTPSERIDQNHVVLAYNNGLRAVCQDLGVLFVEITTDILQEDGRANPDYCGDHVHMNNQIQPLVERILLKHNWLQESLYDQEFQWDTKAVQSEYVFNEKFGCFVSNKTKS